MNVNTDAALEAIDKVRKGLNETAAAIIALCEAAPHPVTAEIQKRFTAFSLELPLDRFDEALRRLAEAY